MRSPINHDSSGNLNKLKIGQKVRATPRLVDWFSSHFSWAYGSTPPENTGYCEGEKEIRVENMNSLFIWSWAKLSGKMPTGVVTHYGAEDWDEKSKKHVNRKCVWVVFTLRTGFGNVTNGTYVSELDLVALPKKSKSRR